MHLSNVRPKVHFQMKYIVHGMSATILQANIKTTDEYLIGNKFLTIEPAETMEELEITEKQSLMAEARASWADKWSSNLESLDLEVLDLEELRGVAEYGDPRAFSQQEYSDERSMLETSSGQIHSGVAPLNKVVQEIHDLQVARAFSNSRPGMKRRIAISNSMSKVDLSQDRRISKLVKILGTLPPKYRSAIDYIKKNVLDGLARYCERKKYHTVRRIIAAFIFANHRHIGIYAQLGELIHDLDLKRSGMFKLVQEIQQASDLCASKNLLEDETMLQDHIKSNLRILQGYLRSISFDQIANMREEFVVKYGQFLNLKSHKPEVIAILVVKLLQPTVTAQELVQKLVSTDEQVGNLMGVIRGVLNRASMASSDLALRLQTQQLSPDEEIDPSIITVPDHASIDTVTVDRSRRWIQSENIEINKVDRSRPIDKSNDGLMVDDQPEQLLKKTTINEPTIRQPAEVMGETSESLLDEYISLESLGQNLRSDPSDTQFQDLHLPLYCCLNILAGHSDMNGGQITPDFWKHKDVFDDESPRKTTKLSMKDTMLLDSSKAVVSIVVLQTEEDRLIWEAMVHIWIRKGADLYHGGTKLVKLDPSETRKLIGKNIVSSIIVDEIYNTTAADQSHRVDGTNKLRIELIRQTASEVDGMMKRDTSAKSSILVAMNQEQYDRLRPTLLGTDVMDCVVYERDSMLDLSRKLLHECYHNNQFETICKLKILSRIKGQQPSTEPVTCRTDYVWVGINREMELVDLEQLQIEIKDDTSREKASRLTDGNDRINFRYGLPGGLMRYLAHSVQELEDTTIKVWLGQKSLIQKYMRKFHRTTPTVEYNVKRLLNNIIFIDHQFTSLDDLTQFIQEDPPVANMAILYPIMDNLIRREYRSGEQFNSMQYIETLADITEDLDHIDERLERNYSNYQQSLIQAGISKSTYDQLIQDYAIAQKDYKDQQIRSMEKALDHFVGQKREFETKLANAPAGMEHEVHLQYAGGSYTGEDSQLRHKMTKLLQTLQQAKNLGRCRQYFPVFLSHDISYTESSESLDLPDIEMLGHKSSTRHLLHETWERSQFMINDLVDLMDHIAGTSFQTIWSTYGKHKSLDVIELNTQTRNWQRRVLHQVG